MCWQFGGYIVWSCHLWKHIFSIKFENHEDDVLVQGLENCISVMKIFSQHRPNFD